MNKNGMELGIQTIIVLILAVLVLVILVIAFRSQIYSLFSSFTNLISNANTSINNLPSVGK
ncbi:MAG: hypothetical protein AABX61_00075 [Nanoarchaeota archaeon]